MWGSSKSTNKQRMPLGKTLGSLYGGLRGYNPMGLLQGFGNDFKSAAGIPDDAKLWDKKRGLQLGALPKNVYETSYSVNPTASGLDASKNFGGLGDTYNFDSSSPYHALNGVNRSALVDALKDSPTAPAINGTALTQDQLNAAVKLGDVNATQNVIGQQLPKVSDVRMGDLANLASLGIQGFRAGKGMMENASADTALNNTIRDIKASSYANPMVGQYLTADQRRLLQQAKSGQASANSWGGAMQGAATGIPKALISGLFGYLTGGVPGALINGVGALGNSAIQGYGNSVQEQQSKYDSLYNALQQAELSYNDDANQRIRNRHFNRMY